MKFSVLCVFDRKAEVYGQPYFVASIGGAIRSFSDEINREAADNVLYQHPDDFELYQIGEFSDQDALWTPCDQRLLVTGTDIKRRGN